MTIQGPEALRYENESLWMDSTPLEDYFLITGNRPPFRSQHTANRRGYVGSWEILGHRLYLVDLSGRLQNGSEVALKALFPNFGTRVFAHWFSGRLRVLKGEIVRHEIASIGRHSMEFILRVEQGVIVDKTDEPSIGARWTV